MLASRRNTANIYDGCLNYLKGSLSSKFAQGQYWTTGDIKSLVGNPEPVNAFNTPYTSSPAYIEIYFGDSYIFPSSYSLMGRRTANNSFLKTWKFSGRKKNGEWLLLHLQENKPFTFAEERTYRIRAKESFSGFKIEMTETNTIGDWGICLGQIEVFGDIYPTSNICPFRLNTKHCLCSTFSFHYYIILCLIS